MSTQPTIPEITRDLIHLEPPSLLTQLLIKSNIQVGSQKISKGEFMIVWNTLTETTGKAFFDGEDLECLFDFLDEDKDNVISHQKF